MNILNKLGFVKLDNMDKVQSWRNKKWLTANQVKEGVFAIYTSHAGGNLEHKNRTTKFDTVEDDDPLQSISKSA